MAIPEMPKDGILKANDGMPQKQFYMHHSFPSNGFGPVMEKIGPHLDFQMSLEESGIMFGAGPFWDETEEKWGGEGMVIIGANSIEVVRNIAE